MSGRDLTNGRISNFIAYDGYYVCPVISLTSCVKWARGDGSPEKTYEILETENGC